MMHPRSVTTAAVILTLASTVLSGTAWAGMYKVHGCRTPSGAIAPTDGWEPSSEASWVIIENTCQSGGGLTIELDPNLSHRADWTGATWSFAAPPNTSIVAFAAYRAARVGRGVANGSPEAVIGEHSRFLETCAQFYGCSGRGSLSTWAAAENSFTARDLNTSRVYVRVFCGGGGTCPAEDPSAVMTLFRSEVTLSDALDPQPSAISGDLMRAGPHHGAESITFNATDQGSGLYRAIVEIDGGPVFDELIDGNGGSCGDVQPGNGDPYEFFDTQPCKLAANVTIDLDTTRIPDGDHILRVTAYDAAGNVATVYGPSSFQVDNHGGARVARGEANGENASDAAQLVVRFQGSGVQRHTSTYGRRVKIHGTLRNERDAPIVHAKVEILGRTAGREWAQIGDGAVRTRPDGTFTLTLPRTISSRTLRFVYRAQLGDSRAAASASLTLRVRAAIGLAVTPRLVRNGEAILFRGRLLGKPVPVSGKLIEIQVRFPTGWRTFATARTARNGVFRYRYRFSRTYEPTTYLFRVRSRAEAGYPYDTGASRVVRVRVR